MDDTHSESYTRFLTEDEIARAQTMTTAEIFAEGLADLLSIALDGGLSEGEAEDVIHEFLANRARSRWKIIK